MLVLGILISVWGAALLVLSRPLHTGWAQMIRELRAAGFQKAPFGTKFVASERGLRTFRFIGAAGLLAGGVLLALGFLRSGS